MKADIRIVKELPEELQSLDLEAIGSLVSTCSFYCFQDADGKCKNKLLCIHFSDLTVTNDGNFGRWLMKKSWRKPSQVFIWKIFFPYYFKIELSISLGLEIGWPLIPYQLSCRYSYLIRGKQVLLGCWFLVVQALSFWKKIRNAHSIYRWKNCS